MSRKILVTLLTPILLTAAPLALAQQSKATPRIGFLVGSPLSNNLPYVDGFRRGLRELGYVESENIIIEYRSAQGASERLPNLLAELIELKVDVIFVVGAQAAQEAKKASKTIAIVVTNVGDPVRQGLVASLARPGGNVTGLSSVTPDLVGKQLELLKEGFPKISLVAVLWDPTNASNALALGETKTAAEALRVALQPLEVRVPSDFEPAFSAIKRKRANGLIVLRNSIINTHRARIIDFAARSLLPAIYPDGEFVEAGGLASYGPNYSDLFRRAAVYVDRILKGAKPMDLPVEQPTKFELVINLKTAKQIGVTIPQWTLMKADRVIK